MNKKYFTPKKIHAYLRAAIQLVFFLFLPSAFTTAFSGIKSVLTQIGARKSHCMEFVSDSAAGAVCLYDCVWTFFLRLCLCVRNAGGCGA